VLASRPGQTCKTKQQASRTRAPAIGFLAHDIVILLDPKDIVENIHDAYQHRAFRESKYAVLMTGPSGSGDIGAKPFIRHKA
jgi:hypothetical protein